MTWMEETERAKRWRERKMEGKDEEKERAKVEGGRKQGDGGG